ncbi:dihydroorotate oxidase A [Cohaesibacter sp. ES.047]|uniref:quinone-dependent dihydroorotate dehydrogenase n=1 Tax=Cohaesibacter sp. ES.047 TaxID=1798205 RepID=UPI000BB81B85|nr:quinone-dependent dihydroorotate dehydrogenase [Cohaesibacter sp. ES.047]SNY91904.1 dihydroorotate oxidase A [Cohaesibacter sp. ES.047]
MANSLLDTLTRKALFALDPEFAHGMAVKALKTGLVPACKPKTAPALAVKLWDLDFPNPLGMAAGFDKNAEVPDELLRMGFGAAEVGTITPLAQPGNPKPRMFRLVEDDAVINRLGFNNKGHAAARANLTARKTKQGIIGVNVGANKDSTDRTEDYVKGIKAFADVASYFTVNISSPNTPGLRDLQARDALDDLLDRVLEERDRQTGMVGRRVPVLLKIAPDLDELGLDDICSVVLTRGIDGMVVSNTTLDRPAHLHSQAQLKEAGGLSGAPLFAKSTIALAKTRERVGPDLPLVGVGGVQDAGTALEKIRAGAHLVQLYTGWIFGGVTMIPTMLAGMAEELNASGSKTLDAIRGETTSDWASQPLASPDKSI